MLIFDEFPNEEKARAFMAAITEEFALKTYLCRHEDGYLFEVTYKPGKSLHDLRTETKARWMKEGLKGVEQLDVNMVCPDGHLDIFPYRLTTPIVCVERPNNTPFTGTTEKELKAHFLLNDKDPKSDANVESIVEKRVKEFGGVFAGT